MTADFHRACAVGDLVEGRGRAVEVDGVRIAVFREGGRIFALSGQCPHAGAPLGFGWIEDGEIVCPLHRWRFRLTNGRCTTQSGHDLNRFACRIRDGAVWVAIRPADPYSRGELVETTGPEDDGGHTSEPGGGASHD